MLEVDLSKIKLKPDSTILENIRFNISDNNVYTIIGKNGTGKTTLIKALTSLLNKNIYSVEGKVLFQNKDLLSLNKNELLLVRRNKIKYVFQDAINGFDPLKTFKFYFNKLLKDNEEIDQLLDYFILPNSKELFKLYPYEVSGGMAQRINFILALLTRPEIIILDEPTSGIDTAILYLFIERLKAFTRVNDNAVLLVTHDFTFAQKVSDKIAFISGNGLTDFASPDDLLNNNSNAALNVLLESYKQLIS